MAGFAAFDEAQGAVGNKAAHGLARGPAGDVDCSSDPENGKPQPEFSFKAAVAEEMRVDGAVEHGHSQPREDEVFHLLPNMFSVGLFSIHGRDPVWEKRGGKAAALDNGARGVSRDEGLGHVGKKSCGNPSRRVVAKRILGTGMPGLFPWPEGLKAAFS